MPPETLRRSSTEPDIDTVAFSERFFIGIGAARSGTTWLEAVLRRHPDIHLTRVKELHYFNWTLLREPASLPIRAVLAAKRAILRPGLQERLLDGFYGNKHARRFLLREQPNHRWYFRLFAEAPEEGICGEFTPAYATLPEELVAEMAELMPHARIVFIMRDPVERLWSHYRYQIGKGVMTRADISSDPNDFFASRTAYMENIEKYEKYFPKEQIFCGYYEEFTAEPERRFDELCSFLGVAPVNDAMKTMLRKRINASREDDECPPDLRADLNAQFGHLAAQLEAKLGRVPPSWRGEGEA